MTMRRWIGLMILAAMLVFAACGAQAEGVMLGVQVKDTPAPQTPVPQTPVPQTPVPSTPVPSTHASHTPVPEADEMPLALNVMDPVTQEQIASAGLGERILWRGMEGEDVRLMQQRLYQLGYYLGEIDGVFGLGTRTAVYGFQRAHKLAKIDGKVGPETIARMFAEDAIVKPTPTPSPTPTPTPTPTPAPTPIPTPVPTATPNLADAPFALEEMEVYVDGEPFALVLGRDDAGTLLYPLCGVLSHMGYEYAYAAGSWQLTAREDGTELALMTDGSEGLCQSAMDSVAGVIFLTDDVRRVYAYDGEAYVTAELLEQMGLDVVVVGGTPVVDR